MSEKAATLRVEADLKNLARIREFILEHGTAHGGAHKAIMDLITAVDEAVTNIMIHGYRGKAGPVEVGVWHDGQMLVVQVRDKAPPFDPTEAPPPDLSLPLEERPLGGLGIFMMKQSVDDLTYRSLGDGGNELTFRKEV